MASFMSNLNPVPTLPEYTGPYKVGTVDVEIPVSELVSPSPTPDGAADIETVLFRIFYPCVPESRGKRITWLPAPQRLHIAAYAQFLGLGSPLASILSFLPRHLHWTTIPAQKNATLLDPTSGNPSPRWPVMIFSHGLGGNRNAYSHLAGSMASYGVVAICPEHRDRSAVLSLIRAPESQQKRSGVKATRHVVPYSQIPHDQTHEVWEARNKQLRIRLWELGLIFEALMAIDRGDEAIIKSNLNKSTLEAALSQFSGKLDVLDPGKVIFAGHSFGAATVVQLVKSTYYRNHPSVSSMAAPLFTPTENGAITRQITPHTPTILLDMWCFPLLSASTSALYNLPLPCYSRSAQPAMPSPPPGGNAVLAIESAHFFSWTEHLHAKARILSADPSSTSSTPDEPAKRGPIPQQPHFFYVEHSAHLSQSDFGVLFPWLTGKLCGSTQPERVLRLNVRAQLQFLRENGVVVAGTARGDLVDGLGITGGDERNGEEVKGEGNDKWVDRDEGILRKEGGVDAWKWIDICGLLGDGEYPSEGDMSRETEGGESAEAVRAEEGEKEMQAEIEPSLEAAVEGKLAEAGREVLGA